MSLFSGLFLKRGGAFRQALLGAGGYTEK
uniref:Uncharacterized protein n=1 Tax=mine drainage metagenome TaxID=410659 RepID=E6PH94_9ZZZZ